MPGFTDFMPADGRPRTRGKLYESLQKYLKRRNREFVKLPRAKQRVQIAKDVLQQLEMGKIIPRTTYFTSLTPTGNYQDEELCTLTAQTKCEVCGIGALFIAAVERTDEIEVGEFEGRDARDKIVEYLSKWFDSDDLDLIEAYFERNQRGGVKFPMDWDSPILKADDRGDRMRMIMENIVSNRGRFDVSRGKHRNA